MQFSMDPHPVSSPHQKLPHSEGAPTTTAPYAHAPHGHAMSDQAAYYLQAQLPRGYVIHQGFPVAPVPQVCEIFEMVNGSS